MVNSRERGMKACKLIFLFCVCIVTNLGPGTSQTLPKLPLGRSTFLRIIEDGNCYIDKTAMIYNLLKSNHRYFFVARPRQFGRTLFLTTLEALFNGKKNFFKNLAIATSDYSWQKHPVLRLDFLGMDTTCGSTFTKRLCREIQYIAQDYNITINKEKSLIEQFNILVHELDKQYCDHSVVLLVDEYDKPLRDNINDKEEYKKIEAILKKLYDVVGQCDDCWHVVFFTSLTKCSKQKLFSGICDLYDISERIEAAQLFGFSREEILNNIGAHLQSYARQQGLTEQQVLEFIVVWCGGYNFSCCLQNTYVINPRSALYHLNNEKPGNYFFEGCTPSFLIELLKQRKFSFVLPEIVRIKMNALEDYDLQTMLPEVALYTAGYLSLFGIDNANHEYLLKIPNKEVAQSFQILKREILRIRGVN
jgi:hypothetical protein